MIFPGLAFHQSFQISLKFLMQNKMSSKRKIWLNVHLFLALSVGFLFVILGLTGSVNVFMVELEEINLPEVQHKSFDKLCSLDIVLSKVKAAHPQRKDRWTMALPGHDRRYIWVMYAKPIETADEFYAPLRVLVHPYTCEIVTQHFWGKTFWSLVYELHADLLFGKLGTELGKPAFKIVCFSGIFLMISVFSGLYLWWPKNRKKLAQSFSIKMNTSQQRRYFDWHKTAGFSTAIFLLIVAISGLSFGYMSYMKSLVSIFSEVDAIHHQEPKLLKSTALNTQSITLDQAVKVADRVFPDAITRWVATPEGRDGVYAIEKRQPGEANQRRPRSKIWLDQYSGQVLKKEDPKNFTAGETLLNLMWPLHSGEALGLPGRILWCILGFSPLLLYITGLLRWQQKRRSAEFSIRRKAKMPAIRND